MYNNPVAGSAVGTAGALAATGGDVLSVGWMLVAAITLMFAGLAVKNLIPVRRNSDD